MTVDIGSKWAPGNRVIKDERTGEFQEINPKMQDADLPIQAALLNPMKWPPEVTAWLKTQVSDRDDEDGYQLDVLAEHASMIHPEE